MAEAAELSNDWTVLDQKLKTFNRLMTTKASDRADTRRTDLDAQQGHSCTGTFLSFRPRSDIRYP